MIAITFISTPLLIKWLGKEQLGTFKILHEWSFAIGIFYLGLAGALIAVLSKTVATNNEIKIKQSIQAGIKSYVYVLPLIISASIVILILIPKLINSTTIPLGSIKLGFIILSFPIFFAPFETLRIYIEAKQRSDLINIVSFIQLVVMATLSLIFAYLGYGLSGQSIAYVISALLLSLAYLFMAKMFIKNIFSDFFNKNQYTKEIWKLNWQTFIFDLSGRLALHLDNVVIGYFISPIAVIPFFITQKLPQMAQRQLQSIGNSVWAPLIDFYHKKDFISFNEKLIESNKFISIMACAIILPIISYNKSFITLWTGVTTYAGMEFTLLACLIAFTQALVSFWSWIFVSSGKIKSQIPIHITASILNFGLSVYLTPKIGIKGPLYGTVISYIIILIPGSIYLLKNSFAISPTKIIFSIFLPLIQATFFLFVARILIDNEILSWPKLIMVFCLTPICYLLISWITLLNHRERTIWKNRLKNIVSLIR